MLVPTGRAVPAAFNRADGTFRYFHLQAHGGGAGPFITAVDGQTFNKNDLFRTQDGEFLARGIPVSAVAAFPKHIVFAKDKMITAIDRANLLVEKEVVNRKGEKEKRIVYNRLR